MSELETTKGVWREHDCGGSATEIIADDGFVVAAVWHEADAPLIAAAPELYAALERAYNLGSMLPEHVRQPMAAALMKARGEA